MSETKLTPEQQNELTQKIWSLRNKMTAQLAELENIHAKGFPNVDDAIMALYTVHFTWNSKEYQELETLIKTIQPE